jgi:hypothetical protein
MYPTLIWWLFFCRREIQRGTYSSPKPPRKLKIQSLNPLSLEVAKMSSESILSLTKFIKPDTPLSRKIRRWILDIDVIFNCNLT